MTKKTAVKKDAVKKVRLTLLKSRYGQLHMHRNNLHGLGLTRRHQTVEHMATPEIMGMVNASAFMLKVEEV